LFNQVKYNTEHAKQAIPIEQVFRDFTGTEIKFRGNTGKGACPFHNDKDPSLIIYRDKNRFKCFGCGASGSVIDVVMLALHLSFRDAAHHLMQTYGLQTYSTPEARKKFDRIQKELEWQREFDARVERVYYRLCDMFRAIDRNFGTYQGYEDYGGLTHISDTLEAVLDELMSRDKERQRKALDYAHKWVGVA